jgi:hypothetical protein
LYFLIFMHKYWLADWLKTEEPSTHKVHIYKEYHSKCPLVGIGTLPPPLSPASVPLPPETKGRGVTFACGWEVGESQFRRLEKSLALCVLCGSTLLHILSSTVGRMILTGPMECRREEPMVCVSQEMDQLTRSHCYTIQSNHALPFVFDALRIN